MAKKFKKIEESSARADVNAMVSQEEVLASMQNEEPQEHTYPLFQLGKFCNVFIVLEMPYHGKEALEDSRLEGRDPSGFRIHFNSQAKQDGKAYKGIYDVTKDKNLTTHEERQWVVDKLMAHKNRGRYFTLFVPEEVKVEITAGELAELQRKAALAESE